MKLLDALHIVNDKRGAESETAPPLRLALSCGFTPLHFKTFLAANVVARRPDLSIVVSEGLYGDAAGNVERLDAAGCDAIAAVVEWADLDPRLGARSTGGWATPQLHDLIGTAGLQLARIRDALERHPGIPRVLAGPTLPLPPVFHARPHRLCAFAADLRATLNTFYRDVVASGVVVIAPEAIDGASPFDTRLDVRSELATGFPYTLAHADALARLMASELFPPARKKGLITDLDDTLWRGLVGEAGVDGVCWTLDKNAHIHALYQQFLSSLAASGTLVAVASKNDHALVDQALARPDLLLSARTLFPIEVHWGPKSESVRRILEAWNIAADAVVFVDDSPMELAEVQAAVPGVECLLFPRDNAAAIWPFLTALRERFGADEITAEDALRVESLRSRMQFESERNGDPGRNADKFLRQANAQLVFATVKSADARAFELLNKTNQFNLNGVRFTEGAWSAVLADDRRFIVKAHYTDRFGPLGHIAVLIGAAQDRCVTVEHWVMSCRAFSRRIEHRMLKYLFDRHDVDAIRFAFTPTARNGPIRDFLSSVLGEPVAGPVVVSRQRFEQHCPALHHAVREDEEPI